MHRSKLPIIPRAMTVGRAPTLRNVGTVAVQLWTILASQLA
jgi:hypothetical protein